MKKVFRSSGQALCSAAVGIAVFSVIFGHALNAHSAQGLVRLLEMGPAVLFCFVCYRFFLAGVYVDDRGVEVINVLSRRTIAWTEIKGFYAGRFGRTPKMAYLRLRTGKYVPLHGIRSGGGSIFRRLTERSVVRQVDELNRVLESVGQKRGA